MCDDLTSKTVKTRLCKTVKTIEDSHGRVVEAVARIHVRHPHLRPGAQGRAARPTGLILHNAFIEWFL